VLTALQGWLGPDVFRQGVRAYVDAHAWGNATAADLFAALSEASGEDVGAMLLPYRHQSESGGAQLRERGHRTGDEVHTRRIREIAALDDDRAVPIHEHRPA
jgi:hypothetical protein